MNSDTGPGQWHQWGATIKATFGKLTDDDLLQADGNADRMMGALQKRYGYTKSKAQTEWNRFAQQYTPRPAADETASPAASADLGPAVSQ